MGSVQGRPAVVLCRIVGARSRARSRTRRGATSRLRLSCFAGCAPPWATKAVAMRIARFVPSASGSRPPSRGPPVPVDAREAPGRAGTMSVEDGNAARGPRGWVLPSLPPDLDPPAVFFFSFSFSFFLSLPPPRPRGSMPWVPRATASNGEWAHPVVDCPALRGPSYQPGNLYCALPCLPATRRAWVCAYWRANLVARRKTRLAEDGAYKGRRLR